MCAGERLPGQSQQAFSTYLPGPEVVTLCGPGCWQEGSAAGCVWGLLCPLLYALLFFLVLVFRMQVNLRLGRNVTFMYGLLVCDC